VARVFSSVSASCRDCSEKQRLVSAAGRERLLDRRACGPLARHGNTNLGAASVDRWIARATTCKALAKLDVEP
jgi:hypothetical protein